MDKQRELKLQGTGNYNIIINQALSGGSCRRLSAVTEGIISSRKLWQMLDKLAEACVASPSRCQLAVRFIYFCKVGSCVSLSQGGSWLQKAPELADTGAFLKCKTFYVSAFKDTIYSLVLQTGPVMSYRYIGRYMCLPVLSSGAQTEPQRSQIQR